MWAVCLWVHVKKIKIRERGWIIFENQSAFISQPHPWKYTYVLTVSRLQTTFAHSVTIEFCLLPTPWIKQELYCICLHQHHITLDIIEIAKMRGLFIVALLAVIAFTSVSSSSSLVKMARNSAVLVIWWNSSRTLHDFEGQTDATTLEFHATLNC